MEQTRKTAGRPGRPPVGKSLTPDAVAEAAARLIDAEGIEDFSMRGWASASGSRRWRCTTTSGTRRRSSTPWPTWRWRVFPSLRAKGAGGTASRGSVCAARDMARRHPNTFRVAFMRRVVPTAALPAVEGILAAFADAGLGPDAQAGC